MADQTTLTMDKVEGTYQTLDATLHYLPAQERAMIRRAFTTAHTAHITQNRKLGEPYIFHPLAIAQTLANMHMDAASIATALLHDVLEDTTLLYENLHEEFGAEIAQLVLGLTKFDERVEALRTLRLQSADHFSREQREAASLVNLFLAMTTDLRIIVIKLADRLHNMQTIQGLTPEKQRRMAQETANLFVPVATRLGIWFLKQQLSDLSLSVLEEDTYAEISEMLAARRQLLAHDLEATIAQLQQRLGQHGIAADIAPLPEAISSRYRQIQLHKWDNAHAYDGLRLRVIVGNWEECYLSLGSIHQLWKPMPGQFTDYIAEPKEGLYRSLHTVVISPQGHSVEIRILTQQMQRIADYGIVVYLQHGKTEPLPSLPWLTQVASLSEEDPLSFLNQFKSEVASERIHVFTPKGRVINLPAGSTPVDFAYAIHTEIGHSCRRALVNRQYVPLNTPLPNGVQVEIGGGTPMAPERKWLDPDLGYVRHPATMRQIRRWFARQPETELLRQGREVIENEIALWGGCDGWTPTSLERLARRRGLSVEDFCLRMGRGDITPGPLGAFILDEVLGATGNRPHRIILEIDVMDRPRFMRDALDVVAEENINLPSLRGDTTGATGLAIVQITVAMDDIRTIVRLAHRLAEVQSVLRVRRIKSAPQA